MSRKGKEFILLSICAFMALLTIVGLCFPLVVLDLKGTIYFSVVSENGFDFFAFKSKFFYADYSLTAIMGGIINIIILFAGIVAVGLTVYGFIANARNKTTKVKIAVIIITLIASVIYMVEGLAFSPIAEEAHRYNKLTFCTMAYIPFIIVSISAIACILCDIFIPVNDGKTKLDNKNGFVGKVDNGVDEMSGRIELLKKYKQLFDEGVITQEEFEEQKNKLLK